MRITTLAFLAAASPLALTAAHAADIDAPSRIDAVTVFPDGAMVTRLTEVALPQGNSTLLIKGLPTVLDPASVRVEAIADGALAIGSVETRLSPGDARPVVDAALEARITALKDQSETIAARLDALDVKRKSIVRFSETSPTGQGKDDKGIDPANWKSAWDVVGDELARVNEDIRVARGKRTELTEQIAALEQARPATAKPGAPKRDITVAVAAGGALKATLTIVYRVSQAAWTPRYDAKLDTGAKGRKPSLELVRRAEVTQRTGEDWDEATIAVSTVRTQGGTAAPEVTPMIVSFADDFYAASRAAGAADRARREFKAAAPAAVPSTAMAPPPVAKEQAMEPAKPVFATLDAGAFQASFKVPGRVSVPRDGSPKTFALSSTTLPPELTARISPALDQTAYLDLSFIQNEDAPLLPGEVNIQRDGIFVGKGRFPLVAPGDKATLGAGSDDRIKVARVPLRQKDNEPGWINSSRSQVTEFKTSIKNLHEAPIHIMLTDRIPVSDVNQITVEPLSSNTPATDKSVADKRGVSAWTFDLAASEAKDIRFGWRLKWPGDREILMHAEPK
ncbi:mucoidy inhibitor MuiA family protein [Bradyrhizobium prioriisuperbiae]|uniref:mucoidy inhibitor MuiA family protein n=1 Tax=Bradyrhizobium prioriisuperbiae TaxID=2854389 RepID=UPI0028E33D23|nr:mucoidy inhibitor MuiA family protein [Bradyrhizobium prioritasuperba]